MRYSQKELAELVGKKQTALYQWENGRTEPSIQNIAILARILETTPEWLAWGRENERA